MHEGRLIKYSCAEVFLRFKNRCESEMQKGKEATVMGVKNSALELFVVLTNSKKAMNDLRSWSETF